jgi:hypothetical protein
VISAGTLVRDARALEVADVLCDGRPTVLRALEDDVVIDVAVSERRARAP